jgi:citrate synthase
MSADADIRFGLAGVIADQTAISKVMADTNSLTYRGYPVEELCAACRFEDVAHLLLHGELPDTAQAQAFAARERAARQLPWKVQQAVMMCDRDAHPMDVLRTAVSLLGAEDPGAGAADAEAALERVLDLYAKIPTIVAMDLRRRHGRDPVAPRSDLGFSENFFHMCFEATPEPELVRCFDISMVLYAEHSFNASTFTARTVTSTTSDVYSAVVAAIGALKGPLHGGANEAVMHMLLEVGSPDAADAWLERALAEGRKIMGFGHRVYRSGDSRVPTMTAAFHRVAALRNGRRWVAISDRLASGMLKAKAIHPNLDFPTGPAYYLSGFDIPMFTPLFVMSRIVGWGAHIIEQQQNNRLIRPLSAYVGPDQRSVRRSRRAAKSAAI